MWGGLLASGSVAFLLVGNSYVARNTLSERLDERLESSGGIVEASVEAVTMSGARWSDHGRSLEDPTSALAQATTAFVWDTWILQEQSQILGFPEGEAERVASSAAVEVLGAETPVFCD